MKSIDHKKGRKLGFHHTNEMKELLSKRARLQGAIRRGYREYQALENPSLLD